MSIAHAYKPFAGSSSSPALPKGGRKIPSVASGIDKVAATSSLMSMAHARQRGNARCRVLLNCLLHNADSTQFVRQATQGAHEGKWYAPARPLDRKSVV